MHGQRNYSGKDYLDYVENEYTMDILDAAGVRRGRRQHHKQEWDRRCHEPLITREELDRKLKQHPDNAALCRSWNAGAKDASHFAEMLGLKSGVTNAEWLDPWTQTREKLHVMEVTTRVLAQSNKDEDERDNFSPPAEETFAFVDIKVTVIQVLNKKLSVSEHSIEVVIKIVGRFVLAQPVDSRSVHALIGMLTLPKETVQQRRQRMREENKRRYVTMPGTEVQISKERLTAMMVQEVLRDGRADGTCLSKDCVARIKTTAARVKAEAEDRDEAAMEGDRACLQDDLAFCFVHADGKKKLWIGKLQQMRSKIGRNTRNLHRSIDLCNPPADLKMQCQWYHETSKGSGRYRPSVRTVNVDKAFVDAGACLGLVELEYQNSYYTIVANGQLDRFNRLMNAIN